MNATRALAGQPAYVGVANLTQLPDKVLKLASPNPEEVAIEDHAYALTLLSIFEDEQHANDLLEACNYSGRSLGPLLDQIERTATAEDITLVTGRRNAYKEAGLKGVPISFTAFRVFMKGFNTLEYKCPSNQRTSDIDLMQMIGSLFIKDPAQRKNWSNHLNQPLIFDAAGVRMSGPPQTFGEAKLLAEKILRSETTIAGIDELGQSSGSVLSSEQVAALSAASIDVAFIPAEQAILVADALLADPRKTLGLPSDKSQDYGKSIDVPRGEDNKYLYWAPPMSQCDCGAPDEGRHIKYKWPCKYYRNPDKQNGGESAKGNRGIGKGKDRKGRFGRGGKGQFANMTEEQLESLATRVAAAQKPAPSGTSSASSTAPSTAGSSTPQAACSAAATQKVCNITDYDNNNTELKALLDSPSLKISLEEFFAGEVSAAEAMPDFSVSSAAETLLLEPSCFRGNRQFRYLSSSLVFDTGLQLSTSSHIYRLRADAYSELIRAALPVVCVTRGTVAATDSTATLPVCSRADEPSLDYSNRPSGFRFGRSKGVVGAAASQSVLECADRCEFGATFAQLRSALESACPVSPVSVLVNSSPTANSPAPTDRAAWCSFGSSTSLCQYAFFDALSAPRDVSAASAASAASATSISRKGESVIAPSDHIGLPIFRAPIDSGCSASFTNVFEHLTDVKKCNEEFKVADGKVSRCLAMGKMPVLAKDSNGKIYRFVLTDVRYVPDFKYTLVSVKQIWNDQRIDAQFADKNCLSFPGSVGVTIPFDNQHKLFTVTLVSEPLLLKTLQASRLSRTRTQPVHVCCLGFHNVKSISHVAHLPIAQASELIHRRCHFGVNKLRVLPHT